MCSLSDLAEACEDEEFVVNDMQANGLKGFKRRPFIKAVNADHPIRNGDAEAAFNLRQSFSVVGLLQETDKFYEMVTRRIH
jgi:hypothetical protein